MGIGTKLLDRITPGVVKAAVVGWADKAAAAGRPASDVGPSIVAAELPAWLGGMAVDAYKLRPYTTSEAVYTCVSKIAQSVSRLRTLVYRRDAKGQLVLAPDHPAQELYDRVNDGATASDFWTHLTSHLLLGGVSAFAMEADARGQPAELWPLYPHMLERDQEQQRPDPDRGWRWMYGQRTASARVVFWDSDLCWLRFFNPNSATEPFAPLTALDQTVKTDFYAAQTNLAMFINGGRPDAVLMSEQRLDQPTRTRLRQQWDEVFRGPTNAHRTAILSHGLKYEDVTKTLRDLEYTAGREQALRTILMVFGVPPTVAGVSIPGWGTPEKEQRQQYWSDTVLNLTEFVDGLMTERMRRVWPSDPPVFGRDTTSIEHIISQEAELLDRHLPELDRGSMTINELRATLGRPPVRWGDAWWAPFSVSPVESASGFSAEPATAGQAVATLQQKMHVRALAEPRVAKWPTRLVAQKRASVLQLSVRLARGFEPEVRDILEDLGRTIKPRPGNPFSRKTWTATMLERGTPLLGDMIWRAWLAEDEVMRAALKSFLGGITKEAALPSVLIESTYAQRMLARQAQRFATQIPETVWVRVNTSLVEGVAAGESETMLADRVNETMGNYIASSARTIARTEAHAAANEGTESRWQDGGEVGTHAWSAVGDERTREAHLEADGQEVPLGDSFDVGGEELEYPGDPTGSAENIILCRCITLPGLKER